MTKKLTITVSDEVYEGLRVRIGPRKISQFIDGLVRPHVCHAALLAEYEAAAKDEAREAEAKEWDELGIADGLDELGEEDWPEEWLNAKG